jgi:cell division protein FtsB
MLANYLCANGRSRGWVSPAALAVVLLSFQQLVLADTTEDIATLKRRVAGLQRQVATMQARNTTLNTQLATLKTQVAALQSQSNQIAALKTQVAAMQSQASALKPLASLAPYVRLDLSTINGVIGPHVIFEGVNVHVRSGMGPVTDVIDAYSFNDAFGAYGTVQYTNGLGNLIVGYDELPCMAKGCPPLPAHRQGSHNLVVGFGHQFSDLGAVVAGVNGVSGAPSANVLGGWNNQALSVMASALGGELNQAVGRSSTVVGGLSNTASGSFAAIVGGYGNIATNTAATVSGGDKGQATGEYSTVSGGFRRSATTNDSWAAGGYSSPQ